MRGLEAVRYSGAGLFFFGAVLLAILAGLTVFGYLRSAVPSVEVLTVTRDLPPGATLEAGDIVTKTITQGAVPKGALTVVKDAVGQRIRYGLVEGDYLRDSHLVPRDTSDVAEKVTETGAGYRAVMLPGELVPAPDRLIPGDRLELTAVLPLQSQQVDTQVAMPLGLVTVIDTKTAKGNSDDTVVIVALPAAEVSKLALAMRTGSLLVAVHGTGDVTPSGGPVRLDLLTTGAMPTAQPIKQ